MKLAAKLVATANLRQIIIVAAVLVALHGNGFAEAIDDSPPRTIKQSLVITDSTVESTAELMESMQVHCGALKLREKYAVEVLIENHSSRVFDVDEIQTSCGCTTTNVEGFLLSPQNSQLVEFQFIPSSPSNGQEQQVSIFFKSEGHFLFRIRLVWEPSGLFRFVHPFVEKEVGDTGETKIQLSVHSSNDIDLQSVQAEADHPIDALPIEWDPKHKGLVVTVPNDFFDGTTSHSVQGHIRLQVPGVENKLSILLRLRKGDRYTVYPLTASFKPPTKETSSEPSDRLVARVVVGCNQTDRGEAKPHIVASLDGLPLAANIVRTSGKMAFVDLTASKDSLEQHAEDEILLTLSNPDHTESHSLSFLLR